MVLALLFGDVVVGASSVHHAVGAQVPGRHARCFVFFPLFLRCSGSSAGSRTPVWQRQLSFTFLSISFSSDIVYSLSSTRFNSVALSSSPGVISPFSPLHRSYKLVESGLVTHCPCQTKTGPVSSKEIQMSIVYTPLFTSSLFTVPSRNVRIPFVQHHKMFSVARPSASR